MLASPDRLTAITENGIQIALQWVWIGSSPLHFFHNNTIRIFLSCAYWPAGIVRKGCHKDNLLKYLEWNSYLLSCCGGSFSLCLSASEQVQQQRGLGHWFSLSGAVARVDLRWVEIHDAPTCSNLFHTFLIFSPIHPLAIDIKHVDNGGLHWDKEKGAMLEEGCERKAHLSPNYEVRLKGWQSLWFAASLHCITFFFNHWLPVQL